MYAVSDTWATARGSFLAPEGLIEISCYIPALKNTLVYTKKDLLSFAHQQTGSLVSGELPKNHIEFALDNSDGKWNPSNPRGLARYLSERLKVTLRYGYLINGVEEWIPGGVFYLSEWSTSLNGIEANFAARDILEYMIDTPYTGDVYGTLYNIAQKAIAEASLPTDPHTGMESLVLGTSTLGSSVLGFVQAASISISDELKKHSVGSIEYEGDETVAVILQKCANAAGCVMYQNRNGVFVIDKLPYADTGYLIPKKLSYAYPEIDLSRPIKNVSVTYYNDAEVVCSFNVEGETQTLTNNYIQSKVRALKLARWVYNNMRSRQQISGEFRGDPSLDIFDVVNVESKYGTIAGVVLTDIKISFTGAFRVAYSGYVRGSSTSATVYSGEKFAGEVV